MNDNKMLMERFIVNKQYFNPFQFYFLCSQKTKELKIKNQKFY